MTQEEFSKLIDFGILRAVFSASLDGLSYTNEKGDILYSNQAYYRLTGIQPGTIVGHNVYDLVKQGYPVSELVIQVHRTKETAYRVIHYSPGGNEILVSSTPVYDSKSNFIGTLENFRNMTTLNDVRSSLELIDLKSRMMLEDKERLLEHVRNQSAEDLSALHDMDVVGNSRQMRNLFELARRICNVNSTVLITGESGVGKDVFCKLVRYLSDRDQPYVKVSCAAIPETLLESELFGYEPGAFTGASKHGKAGLLEQAEGGIVFLDEIGCMPLRLQSKLLTLLQDRWYYRVGGTKQIPLRARIMAATNINLKQAVAEGTFRGDLYYRLNVIPVYIPPLRERRDDIVPLVFHMLKKLNVAYSSSKEFSNDALAAFKRYDWPGNIRELNNIVERMYVMSINDIIGVEMLPSEVFGPTERMRLTLQFRGKSLNESMEQIEASLIQDALESNAPLQSIAENLDISLSTLERKIKKYGLPMRYQTANTRTSHKNQSGGNTQETNEKR